MNETTQTSEPPSVAPVAETPVAETPVAEKPVAESAMRQLDIAAQSPPLQVVPNPPPHYGVHWKVAIMLATGGNGDWLAAQTSEIAEDGVVVFSERNLQNQSGLVVQVCIPAIGVEKAPTVLTLHGKVLSSIYAAREKCFRTSIKFTQPEEADRARLRQQLLKDRVDLRTLS